MNLNQKITTVNVIKHFGDENLWFAYANNTIAVYKIEEEEIKFDIFEKKTPFEVLEILQVNEQLYVIAGFAPRVVLVNSQGYFLKNISNFENSILLRRMTYHKESGNLSIAHDFNKISSFRLALKAKTFILENLWVKIQNFSQVELSLFDASNMSNQDSYDNYLININGYV
ncbi:MAG: hypothetical protein GY823_09390 [Flavobacteriaceae bacterium]|nr:hypothetical protein [Flavobacteriaceae bacterium]